MTEIRDIPLNQIQADGTTQMRVAGIDPAVVADYADAMEDGASIRRARGSGGGDGPGGMGALQHPGTRRCGIRGGVPPGVFSGYRSPRPGLKAGSCPIWNSVSAGSSAPSTRGRISPDPGRHFSKRWNRAPVARWSASRTRLPG